MSNPWETRAKRPGVFIRQFLSGDMSIAPRIRDGVPANRMSEIPHVTPHSPASPAELHRAFSYWINAENVRRQVQRRADLLRKPTYHSFWNYFRVIVKLGWVEREGEERPAANFRGDPATVRFVEERDGKPKLYSGARERLWRLTDRGQQEREGWENPWKATLNSPEE